MATFDSHPNGHLEFQAEVSFKYGTNVAQSAKIILETGEQGKVEVTYSGLQSHSMRLEMNENRVRRAIFESDSMGTYAFESDQDTLKGVLVLTTPQVTYYTLFEKSNFCPIIQNSILTEPQHFHEFFALIFFFDNFSREIKVVNS